MIKEIDVLYIKKKFATLLSKLYTDAKIDLDLINNKLVYSDFLDCFETNDISYFLNNSDNVLIYDLFKKELIFSEEINAKIYWSGIQYMNIFFNSRIPLKQIFLLCPLSKMITYFDIYHELNEKELILRFMREDYKESILRKLIKDSSLNLKEISILTNININTLKYYELSNDNLFNGSFENINKIKNILNVNESLFIKESSFLPFTRNILKNKDIYNEINNYLNNYYKTESDFICEDGLFIKKIKNKKVFVQDKIMYHALKYAISIYTNDQLLF